MELSGSSSIIEKEGFLLKIEQDSWKWFRVKLLNKQLLLLQNIDNPSTSISLDLHQYTLHPTGRKQNQYRFSLCPIDATIHCTIERFSTPHSSDYSSWIRILTQIVKPIEDEPLHGRLSAPIIMAVSAPAITPLNVIVRGNTHVLWYPTSPRMDPEQRRKRAPMGTRKAYSLKDDRRLLQNHRHRTVELEEMRRSEKPSSMSQRKPLPKLKHDTLNTIQDQLDNIPDFPHDNDLEGDYTDEIMLALREEELLAKTTDNNGSRSHTIINGILDELIIKTNDMFNGWIVPDKVLGSPRSPRITSPSAGHRKFSPTQIELMNERDEQYHLQKLKKKYITPGDPRKKYIITNQTIGKGSVGEVLFASRGDQKVAIKKLELIRRGRDRLPLILREIEIIATSAHSNIVEYIETFDMGEELWVVMEYMSGGSLYDLVKLHLTGIYLTEEQVSYAIKQVLEALAFLHQRSRIHRDIKVDNILLDKDGSVKLADFGTAVQLTFQRLQRNTLAGTPYYMAPELIQRIPYKEKVDIWAVGITIMELMTGRPPFYDLEPEEALDAIVKYGVQGLVGKNFSEEIRDFTNRGCLSHEPGQRASARELLMHSFIKKACNKAEFAQKLADITKSTQMTEESTSRGCILL